MGKALRRSLEDRRRGWRALARGARRAARAASLGILALFSRLAPHTSLLAQAPERLDKGRFTAVFFPSERLLAQSLLDVAVRIDTFPGLPRPKHQVLLEIAPDRRRFRDWIGPGAPEWGAAITFPEQRRVIMQGKDAGAEAGDPREVWRHELAHLALHEFLGDMPPRWFDEGYASYAAREWRREDVVAANLALVFKGTPTFDELDADFGAGSTTAQNAYALAYRAVVEMAALDTARGLAPFFTNWQRERSMDRAVRRTYGITLSGFERLWQQRTRRRYGALALAGDVTLGGLVLLILILPLYIIRRRRDKERMAALVAADLLAEKAARESLLALLLGGRDARDDTTESREETPRTPPT